MDQSRPSHNFIDTSTIFSALGVVALSHFGSSRKLQVQYDQRDIWSKTFQMLPFRMFVSQKWLRVRKR